ncbi:MAG: N-glycosylase/DNA lyase [Candidatus Micrarchaeota archaeon]
MRRRLAEFKAFRKKGSLFPELCYCLMTANARADAAWRAQRECGKQLACSPARRLANTLLEKKVRFHNTKAKRVCEARRLAPRLRKIIYSFNDGRRAREWLVANVNGLGWKEASHFLRNVGFEDVAVIDRHVLRIMRRAKLISEKPAALTEKNYLAFERVLEKEARRLKMTLAELDLFLWSHETGVVLK